MKHRIIRNHAGEALIELGKLFLATVGVATLVISTQPTASRLQAQALGGHAMQFDVASIKQDRDGRVSSNFPLGLGDSYSANGGLFSATFFPVATYIGFAYKLTPYQTQSLQALLPKWANEERFDIQARAAGNPTKDQMRLMMQSLLADRFKLAVRREMREGKIFALVLVNAGRLGPQLRMHSSDSEPCSGFTMSPSAKLASGLPAACDVMLTLLDGDREQTSARNVTLGAIAGSLPFPGMGTLDRPVVDQTGLTGTFDFSIRWVPDGKATPDAQGVDSGPSFQEALQDQLGLKLKATTGKFDTLLINHIEEPSPN